MSEIVLRFPIISGAEEEGLNDAGIETFGGDIGDYIARECGQNTLDAAADGKVELHFDLLDMPLKHLPCLIDLNNTFEQCKQYWISDPKAVDFFETGKNWLKNEVIPVLKVSDYGTTGLTGEDNDRNSKWYGLVRSKGACNKGVGSGGSFGIGKYAPFAASALRTVYYYTKTKDNHAFQGISRLVTHNIKTDVQAHPTGYIGLHIQTEDGKQKFSSVRNIELIPSHFRRNDTEIGTDIYIPAYREKENWRERFTISILNNFWPAICLKRIVFKIDKIVIDETNIDIIIEENKSNPDFKAYRYFNAYRNGRQFRDKLKYVGDSELRLAIDTQRESNPIAVARQNGMIIETWGHFRSRKPISGIYICHDPQGNEVLRKLEPPRHDKWDIKRAENGKDVINTIKNWIKSRIDQMLPADETASFDLDVFSRFIPDEPEEEHGEDSFDEDEKPKNNDGFQATPKENKKDITKAVVSPKVSEQGDQVEKSGTATESGEGNAGGGAKNGVNNTKGNKGGKGYGSGTGGTGTADASTASVHVLDLRSIYDEKDHSYNMIFRTKKKFEGKISFAAECDDGSTENITLHKVLLDTEEVPLIDGGKSFQAVIDTGAPKTFKIYFRDAEKLSVRIV